MKLDLLILRIKNKSTIINSLKSHGDATMQYTHPKRGSLFRSPGAVSESFDLVRRGEIKMPCSFLLRTR